MKRSSSFFNGSKVAGTKPYSGFGEQELKAIRREFILLNEFNQACDRWLRSRGLPTGVSRSSLTTF